MTQIFGSPSTYEQGKGILFQSSESLHKLGKTPVLMADATVYNIIGNQFLDYLKQSKFDVKKNNL